MVRKVITVSALSLSLKDKERLRYRESERKSERERDRDRESLTKCVNRPITDLVTYIALNSDGIGH